METARTNSQNPLYKRLLGDAWARLDRPVREFHERAEVWRGAGLFTVTHGASPLARLMVRALRLPPAGDDVPVRLTVTQRPEGENWRREFAGQLFITNQREQSGGFLAEDFGPSEVWYRLEVSDGALLYRQVKSRLRMGPLRVPALARMFPRISGRESAAPGERGVRVSVNVNVPLIGLLVSYQGWIEKVPDEEGP